MRGLLAAGERPIAGIHGGLGPSLPPQAGSKAANNLVPRRKLVFDHKPDQRRATGPGGDPNFTSNPFLGPKTSPDPENQTNQ
jgi:hypothetical protein